MTLFLGINASYDGAYPGYLAFDTMRDCRNYSTMTGQEYRQLVEAEAAVEAEYAHYATLYNHLVAFGPYANEGLTALEQAQHDAQRFTASVRSRRGSSRNY